VVSVVRHQAKQEPPLLNLTRVTVSDNHTTQAPAEGIVTMVAEITIYGRTTNDRNLTAVTQLQVTFADFASE